jgi:DNA-binding HxlR family transcriptional regulator
MAAQEISGRWKIPLLDSACHPPTHSAMLERTPSPIPRRILTRSLRELQSAA